eukprot:maker-scaffold_43-snap-gene-1.24-mRNA-1 protein AED:0.28 eAED:0.28 QI:32/1/1/1/0/0/3/185/116
MKVQQEIFDEAMQKNLELQKRKLTEMFEANVAGLNKLNAMAESILNAIASEKKKVAEKKDKIQRELEELEAPLSKKRTKDFKEAERKIRMKFLKPCEKFGEQILKDLKQDIRKILS